MGNVGSILTYSVHSVRAFTVVIMVGVHMVLPKERERSVCA